MKPGSIKKTGTFLYIDCVLAELNNKLQDFLSNFSFRGFKGRYFSKRVFSMGR